MAATAIAGGSALAACSGGATGDGGGSSAAPTVQQNVTQLVFQANRQGVSFNKTLLSLYQEFVDSTFNAKNTGLRATVFPGDWGNTGGVISASIAGTGYPDVLASCCDDLSVYVSGSWLVPLDTYLKKDNIDTSVWNQPHIEALSFSGQVLALPSYDGPGVVAYRQDVLDQLGLEYPDPDWTYKDAATIWQQCAESSYGTGTTQKRRLGISFLSLDNGHLNWWMHAWGGQEMDATRTQCLAGSSAGVGALSWIADLQKNKIAVSDSGEVGRLNGQASSAFAMVGGWNVFPLATQIGEKYKWDLLPVPKFPGGRATYCNIDFYGINRATKYLDHSWELMKYLTFESDWQRFQMKTTLVQPCLNALWSEWETIVKQVAPPLQNKQLHWYQDAAQGGYAWPTLFFQYNSNQVNTAMDGWLTKIGSGTVSAQQGMTQMASQIDAVEAAGAAESIRANAMVAAFPTQGPTMAAVQPGL